MSKIIATVGYPGSGKSEVAKYVSERGVPVISMGEILREKYNNRTQKDKTSEKNSCSDNTRSDNIGEWATEVREEKGYNIVAKWTANHIENNISQNTVFIDGTRSRKEIKVFEEKFDSVYIVYVACDFDIRLSRLQDRGRDGEDEFTKEDLYERDKREEKWGLSEAIEISDYEISNNKSLNNLYEQIDEIIEDIEIKQE